MMTKEIKITFFLLLALIASSCNISNQQPIEVTKIVPQTVIVTQIVKETVLVASEPTASPEYIPPTNIDPAYYDGIVVITQYYTYLGNGLHERAYELLSSSAREHHPTKEDYLEVTKQAFKSVEIISIIPDYVRVINQGGHPKPEPADEKRFQVKIIPVGEGKLSGSRLSGELQTLYLTVKLEDGEWKIDSFSTA